MATISRLSVDLVANSAKFKKDLNSASKSAKKSFGSMMKSAKLATAAFAAVGGALGGALLSSAKVYGDFTEALQDVKAKTGATANQLDELSVSMRNAAKATRFTATQTAEAGTFLAQAGLNVREINDALRPTLDLAAATKTSVQQTADFMTNIMKGMGMASTELERAADVLALTTAKSNTSLTDLATAMSYAAPSARAMGMEIEETATLIGMMANAGIKGSMAGTALRGSFAALATTGGLTEKAIADSTGAMTQQAKVLRRLGVHTKDAEGNVRGLTAILTDLKEAGGDEQDMIAIFGRRAGSAMMQFMNEGLMGADALKEKLDNARKAAENMAAVQMDSLNGDILLFRSQFEELQMIVAENGIDTLFRNITQSATKFMKNAEPALAVMAKHADEIAVGLLALGGVVVVAGIMKVVVAMALLTKTMLFNPIFLIAAGFTALAVYAYKNIEEITFYWNRFTSNMGIFADNIVGLVTTAWSNIGTNFDIMIVGFLLGLEKFKKAYIDAWNFILSKMNPAVNKLIEMYNAIPFMDDAKPVTLNIDTEKMTSKIKGLSDQMDALVASKNSFTQTALDDSLFIPSDKPVVDGGASIDDVETPESKAQSE
jgi:TP901 family phage tail tape measure protein